MIYTNGAVYMSGTISFPTDIFFRNSLYEFLDSFEKLFRFNCEFSKINENISTDCLTCGRDFAYFWNKLNSVGVVMTCLSIYSSYY